MESAISQPQIIVFAGPVGAGKTTQMKLLASELKSNKVKVTVTFLKTGHLFAYILEITLKNILVGKRKDVHPIRSLIKEKPHLFRRLFKLWLILDAVSVFICFLLTIYLPMKMRHIVLVEEYIPATIADYIYLAQVIGLPLKDISFAVSFMVRLLHLGGSIQIIFLDAYNATLKKRWNNRGSLNEKIDYLHMQRSLLLSLSKRFSSLLLYIDTNNKTIKEINAVIINHLTQSPDANKSRAVRRLKV